MQKSTFVPGTGTNCMPRVFTKECSLVAAAGLVLLNGMSSADAHRVVRKERERKKRRLMIEKHRWSWFCCYTQQVDIFGPNWIEA